MIAGIGYRRYGIIGEESWCGEMSHWNYNNRWAPGKERASNRLRKMVLLNQNLILQSHNSFKNQTTTTEKLCGHLLASGLCFLQISISSLSILNCFSYEITLVHDWLLMSWLMIRSLSKIILWNRTVLLVCWCWCFLVVSTFSRDGVHWSWLFQLLALVSLVLIYSYVRLVCVGVIHEQGWCSYESCYHQRNISCVWFQHTKYRQRIAAGEIKWHLL